MRLLYPSYYVFLILFLASFVQGTSCRQKNTEKRPPRICRIINALQSLHDCIQKHKNSSECVQLHCIRRAIYGVYFLNLIYDVLRARTLSLQCVGCICLIDEHFSFAFLCLPRCSSSATCNKGPFAIHNFCFVHLSIHNYRRVCLFMMRQDCKNHFSDSTGKQF